MTAKLNVATGSYYAPLNGQTFEVVEILGSWGACLLIGDTKTDFRMREITDLQRSPNPNNAYTEMSESMLIGKFEYLLNGSECAARLRMEALDEIKAEIANRKFTAGALRQFVDAGMSIALVKDIISAEVLCFG